MLLLLADAEWEGGCCRDEFEEKDLILGMLRSETDGTGDGEGEGMGDCLNELDDLERFILETIIWRREELEGLDDTPVDACEAAAVGYDCFDASSAVGVVEGGCGTPT